MSGSNPAANSSDKLPPFQSFPAATRDVRLRPNSRSHIPSNDPAEQQVARGDSDQQDSTPALPPFTPFPSAAPTSRWAPPEGSPRPEPPRPVPPPAYEPETAHYPPFQQGEAVRYASGLPSGQPSPYAPPGPLTARPHVCEHCETGFARAHDLRRHLETHSSERPHRCPNCQRSFSRKDAVHRHLVLTQCTGSSSGGSSNQ